MTRPHFATELTNQLCSTAQQRLNIQQPSQQSSSHKLSPSKKGVDWLDPLRMMLVNECASQLISRLATVREYKGNTDD
ncbi:hypothetical protein WJX73_008220 [Symbiochloris irregularis]|uniref:Uncharacterized protein n=1 Tax=Symbiochloris irregularis TaxID=706552 RepID=A0AAW1NKW3_9CHLO